MRDFPVGVIMRMFKHKRRNEHVKSKININDTSCISSYSKLSSKSKWRPSNQGKLRCKSTISSCKKRQVKGGRGDVCLPLLIMTKYSNDKDIQKLICRLVKQDWQFRRRKKHGSIFSPTGKRFTVPGTPSDKRAFKNLNKDIQRSI